jgi:hypothetical protein
MKRWARTAAALLSTQCRAILNYLLQKDDCAVPRFYADVLNNEKLLFSNKFLFNDEKLLLSNEKLLFISGKLLFSNEKLLFISGKLLFINGKLLFING